MSRLVVYRGEFTSPNSTQSQFCAEHVQQPRGDEITAALFCGPLCTEACDKYAAKLSQSNDLNDALLVAADAMDRRLTSMIAEDPMAGWGGTAVGIALSVKKNHCRCAWVGDCQAFHARGHAIHQFTKPHTLYQALCDLGNQPSPEPPRGRCLMRWLSRQHELDILDMPLQDDDTILLC